MSYEQDLKIGDCFPSRESLMENGYHSHPQYGMGKKETDDGTEFIFSIVMSVYPDNEVYPDDIFYTGEGNHNRSLNRITANQSFKNPNNKRMLQSIRFKTPILFFRNENDSYCFNGYFVPTHYVIRRGKHDYEIIDFHLKRLESVGSLVVGKETKEVHIVFLNEYGRNVRRVLVREEIVPFYGHKILDKVGDKKIYNIVN